MTIASPHICADSGALIRRVVARERAWGERAALEAAGAHLQRARARLARTGGWTQGAYARNGAGESVDSRCAEATSFCVSGALSATADEAAGPLDARTILYRTLADDIETWNDTKGRCQREVVAVFDEAIATVLALVATIEAR